MRKPLNDPESRLKLLLRESLVKKPKEEPGLKQKLQLNVQSQKVR